MMHDIREQLQALNQRANNLVLHRPRVEAIGPMIDSFGHLIRIVQMMAIDLYPAVLPPDATNIVKGLDESVSRILGDEGANVLTDTVQLTGEEVKALLRKGAASLTGQGAITSTGGASAFTRQGGSETYSRVILFEGWDWTAEDQEDARALAFTLFCDDDGGLEIKPANQLYRDEKCLRGIADLRFQVGTNRTFKPNELTLIRRALVLVDMSANMVRGQQTKSVPAATPTGDYANLMDVIEKAYRDLGRINGSSSPASIYLMLDNILRDLAAALTPPPVALVGKE